MNYDCNVCGINFKNKKSLSNHRRWHNLPQYKNFQQNYKDSMVNYKHDDTTKKKIGESNLGPKNGMWKGNKVSINKLHAWIRRHKPKPNHCEKCKKAPPYDLANISGQYKRDINDFEWLCRSCHMKSDGRIYNLKQYIGDKN